MAVPDSGGNQSTPAAQRVAPYKRPVLLERIVPKIVDDQSKIWLFPAKLNKKRNCIPTAVILGTTAALIALDSHDAPISGTLQLFSGFSSAFTGNATAIGTAIVPVSLHATGLISKDGKVEGTALLAGRRWQILTFVLKDSFIRAQPASISPTSNFSDTWFESRGSLLSGNGCMPSGHTIATFSVAMIVARRYGNHKSVPYVSYGLAALIGCSRFTLSAHFVPDVFACGALGCSVSRFAAQPWDRLPHLTGDSGEAERLFRREAERHSGMIPNTIGA